MRTLCIGTAAQIALPDKPIQRENEGFPFPAGVDIHLPQSWLGDRVATCRSHPVKVEIYPSKDLAVAAAARDLHTHLLENPSGTTGTATGNTYLPIYQETVRLILADRACGKVLNLNEHRFFGLDEYLVASEAGLKGIDPSHPESFRGFMHRHLAAPIGLPIEQHSLSRWGNFWMPAPGINDQLNEFCLAYERERSRARVQRQYVGMGRNGHVAFIEPQSGPNADLLFWTRTRVVSLTPHTRLANFGDENSPIAFAISVGIQSILDSGHVVLVALGESKAEAVAAALEGPIGPHCPASYLRLLPAGRVTFILDAEAASKLGSTTAST
ncbi:MAG: 6-phosphogluconolactonase [Oligoflexia bacterium]|nr:6-phosphogluconolactonase [Oligoflexia bacterium]